MGGCTGKRTKLFLCILPLITRFSEGGGLTVREAPDKDTASSNGILPNSVSPPPPPQANGRFVAGIFRRKLANSLKQRF